MALAFIDKIIALLDTPENKHTRAHHNNILTEYKNRQNAYEEFRIAVHKALEAMLRENNYKYQILSRTKTPERLREKLSRKEDSGIHYGSLEEIEDLVGVRIIFYTEKDKKEFLGKMKQEIGGFLRLEEREKDNGYNATHVIMSFGPERLKLSEYKHFADLKSEIQITSILHHAWAEIEHDLIYKDIHDLKNQQPEKFEQMKQKMKKIMERYIEKASKELEEVLDQKFK